MAKSKTSKTTKGAKTTGTSRAGVNFALRAGAMGGASNGAQANGSGGNGAPAPVPKAPAGTKLVDLPLAELEAAATSALTAFAAVQAAMPNPSQLTAEDRKHSRGRLRNGEPAVLQVVASVAAKPQYAPLLTSLADLDFGLDPGAFEPTLLAERLQKADALAPLADALTVFAQELSDTVLELQRLAREPLLDAYAILKSVAKKDPVLKGLLNQPIDYYASVAKAAQKTKQAKKKAAATPPKTA